MGLSFHNITKKLGDITGGVERQINPLDNGRTYKQVTPTNNRSLVGQLTHNGITNTVGNVVTKPAVSFGKSMYDIGRGAVASGDIPFTAPNPVALANANRAKLKDNEAALGFIHGFTRTVPEVATSLVNHNAYHPGSQIEQTLFGETPVKSIQKKVVDTYHDRGIGMAALELGGSLLQDAPVGGAAFKAGKSGVKVTAKGAKVVKDASLPLNEVGAVGKDVRNAGKAEVSTKVEPVKPAPVEGDIVSNPTPVPMRNEGGLRDQLGTALIDKDAVGINTLKNIEKVSGESGHVKKFLYNTNMLQQAPGIAAHAFTNSEAMKGAIGGLTHGDYKNFVDYANARAELRNYKPGMSTFRTPAENRAIVRQFHGQFDKNYKSLNQYYKNLADEAHKAGIIDDETFKSYQNNNDYIHLARDMSDLQTFKGQGKAYGLGSTISKLKRQGSGRELLDPIHAALDFTNKSEVEKWKNATATHLVDTLERHGQAKKLVDSSKVLTRREMYRFLSDTREGKKLTDRLVKKHGKEMRVLQSEVDKLNQQGLNLSLKPSKDVRLKPDVASKTTVVRKLGFKEATEDLRSKGKWTPVKADSIRTATTALKGTKWINSTTGVTDALKAYAKSHHLTRAEALIDVHMKRKNVDAYINGKGKEVVVNTSKLRTHTKKMVGEGRLTGKVESVSSRTARMGTLNTKRAVEQLMSTEPADLTRIKTKLGRHEPRLKALITTVEGLRDQSEAFHTARSEAFQKARSLADDSTRGKNTVSIMRNGVREVYEVSPEIKKLTQNMSPFQLSSLERVIGFPARVLRAGATALNPVFTGANYIKDQVGSAVISSKTAATHTPANIGAGLKQSSKAFVGAKNGPLWEEYIKSGGDRTQYDLTRNAKGTKEIVDLARGGNKAAAAHAFTHPIRTLENANSITEKATRFQNFKGIYEDSIKKGLNHDQAVENATMAALEHSVNFSRAGSWGRVINLLIPYSNAAIQGGRTLGNAVKARPFMTATKGFAWVGTPVAAATLWNTSTPDNKKIYENISEYEKQNNIVLIKPGQKYKDVKGGSYDVIKIPLPPDVGTIFNSIRRGIEDHKKVAGREGMNISTVAQDLSKPFTGPVDLTNGVHGAIGSVIPQGAKPAVTIGLNRDLYTGKQVVPDYLKDSQSNPQNQVYKHTSSTARDITGAIKRVTGRNYSPLVVDKFASDAAGKLGTIGINAADNVLAKTGKARVDAKGKPIVGGTSIKSAFTQRFEKAVAKEDPNNQAAKYYKSVDAQYSKLNKNERSAFDTIHTTKVDGNQPDKTLYDSSVRAGIYSKYPKVLAADKAINQDSKDPFWHLPDPQRKVVITLDSLSNDPGSGAAKAIQKENPWLTDYYKQRGSFFDELVASGKIKTASGSKLPTPPKTDANLQAKLDSYGGITDSTEKRSFLTSNPDVSDYFAATDNYQRQKRSLLGLPQFDRYPTPSPDLQRKLDVYNSLPQHDGKKGGNASRYAFIQANPQIGDYFNEVGQWSANNDAQVAVFENHDNKSTSSGGSSSSSHYASSGGSGSSYTNPYAHTVKAYGSSSKKSATVTAHISKTKANVSHKTPKRITMKVTKSKV